MSLQQLNASVLHDTGKIGDSDILKYLLVYLTSNLSILLTAFPSTPLN